MNPTSTNPSYSIRILATAEEFKQAVILQHEVWNITAQSEAIPKDVMIIAQKNGGLALGAFTPANEMIGALWGFLGRREDGTWEHYSHMLGVLPVWRSSGVGKDLKFFQRNYVIQQGLELITWTVSPLESSNASLNFRKLGGVCRQYFPNLYGNMEDGLNMGLPSDRFNMEWWVNSRRVAQRSQKSVSLPGITGLLQAGAKKINSTRQVSHILQTENINLSLNAPILLYEIPENFQYIKTNTPDDAHTWVLNTRKVFEHYFEQGYIISDFISEKQSAHRQNFYILQKNLQDILMQD